MIVKKICFLFFGICFISFKLVAQPGSQVEKYATSIKADDAKRHLTILAADWMEGRETGERGQKMAAAYLADQFRSFGLKPVIKDSNTYSYLQKFDLDISRSTFF